MSLGLRWADTANCLFRVATASGPRVMICPSKHARERQAREASLSGPRCSESAQAVRLCSLQVWSFKLAAQKSYTLRPLTRRDTPLLFQSLPWQIVFQLPLGDSRLTASGIAPPALCRPVPPRPTCPAPPGPARLEQRIF